MNRKNFRREAIFWLALGLACIDSTRGSCQDFAGESPPWGQADPFTISAKYFCEKDSNEGYLIVQVELAEGRYLYSLTQPGPLATKIEVSFGGAARSAGVLRPMSPPEVKSNDELLKGPSEKHFDLVQFALPFRGITETRPEEWKVAIRINGQVCSDVGSCILIHNQVVPAQFEHLDEPTRLALRNNFRDRPEKR